MPRIPETFDVERDRLEMKLASIFNHRAHHVAHGAAQAAEDVNMVLVMAHPDGRLLLMDPYSVTHYLFTPSGPHWEYDSREPVTEISLGEPVPERFVGRESDWEPVDEDWRAKITNGSMEASA